MYNGDSSDSRSLINYERGSKRARIKGTAKVSEEQLVVAPRIGAVVGARIIRVADDGHVGVREEAQDNSHSVVTRCVRSDADAAVAENRM